MLLLQQKYEVALKDIYPLLEHVKLFTGLKKNEMPDVLMSLNASIKKFNKNDVILHEDDKIERIGIVLSGSLQITRTDYAGNRLIIGQLKFPSMFAEAVAFSGRETSPVALKSITDSKVLLIDFRRIASNKNKAHGIITTNMLKILSSKNLFLQQRIDILSKRSTKAKLSAYLLSFLEKSGSNTFEIPFNRFALSDFLCVNRSSMSRELCSMRDEGTINFNKNKFEILDTQKLSFYASKPYSKSSI